jgi:hypothetical protein
LNLVYSIPVEMAVPYIPPTSNIPQPEVPKWNPPEPTKMDLDWAKLRTIDLSLLDSPNPAVVEELVATTKKAIKEDGFLYLTNYGVSLDQVRGLRFKETYLANAVRSFIASSIWLSIYTKIFLRKTRRSSFGIPLPDCSLVSNDERDGR